MGKFPGFAICLECLSPYVALVNDDPYLNRVENVGGGGDWEDGVCDVDEDEEGGDDEGDAAGHVLGDDDERGPGGDDEQRGRDVIVEQVIVDLKGKKGLEDL